MSLAGQDFSLSSNPPTDDKAEQRARCDNGGVLLQVKYIITEVK